MKLQLSTWPEIEDYLTDRRVIVIPIGSTEQHGPTGMIGTDALCPEIVADGMAEKTRILIGPSLSIGMAQHHLAFPGSISLKPSTLVRVVGDVVESLASQGFSHFFFLNGHGGNIASVQAAFSEIWAASSFRAEPSALRLRLHNWFQGARVARLSRQLFGDGEGSHATPSEISLVLSAYPEAARDRPWIRTRQAPDRSGTRRIFGVFTPTVAWERVPAWPPPSMAGGCARRRWPMRWSPWKNSSATDEERPTGAVAPSLKKRFGPIPHGFLREVVGIPQSLARSMHVYP